MSRRPVQVPGLAQAALLHAVPGARGGVVAVHGAGDGSRDQPLFRHLAGTAAGQGLAVLTYDRRSPPRPGRDVPLDDQVGDALVAAEWLAGETGGEVGLLGLSQGAWVAAVAAARSPHRVSHLVLLGSSGVSPARQMRYFTDEQLRRHGHDDRTRARAAALRFDYERALRGQTDRAGVSARLAEAATEPWFPLVHLPEDLPPGWTWPDMDFDPAPVLARVRCPVLLAHGEEEDTVPVEETREAWFRAAEQAGNRAVEAVFLPGCGHFPATVDAAGTVAISPAWTSILADWLARR